MTPSTGQTAHLFDDETDPAGPMLQWVVHCADVPATWRQSPSTARVYVEAYTKAGAEAKAWSTGFPIVNAQLLTDADRDNLRDLMIFLAMPHGSSAP